MINLAEKKTILYRRVSTSDQKDFGNSLTTQYDALYKFCNSSHITILKDFEEDHSAKDFNRPIFSELIQYSTLNKKAINLLLITKWDRFSRNALEALSMIKLFKNMGIEINAIEQWINHNDPNQLIILLMHLGIPEADNLNRSNRIKEGIRNNHKHGRYVVSLPRGYIPGKDEDGKVLMQPHPEKGKLITELFNEYSKGIYSQNQILTKEKYKPLGLDRNSLSRILNNPIYCGKIKVCAYKDEPEQIVDGLHKPLISKEIFKKTQIELGLRRRIKNKPKKINSLLPLRGFMKCVRCGRNLTGSGSKSKTGKKHYYYHCNPRKNCNERIKINHAHEALKNYLNELKPNKGVTELFKVILKKKYEQNSNSKLSHLKSLEEKINKLEKRKNALLDRNLDGIISNEEFKIKNIELDEQIHKLKKEISQLENYNTETMEFVNFGIHLIQNIGKFFEKSDMTTKTMLLSSIFNEKLVFEDNKYRTPVLNKGLELICRNIRALDSIKNKNGRLSFDNIPLSTQDDSVLELFHSDLVKLYKLREHLVMQGLSDYSPTGKNS